MSYMPTVSGHFKSYLKHRNTLRYFWDTVRFSLIWALAMYYSPSMFQRFICVFLLGAVAAVVTIAAVYANCVCFSFLVLETVYECICLRYVHCALIVLHTVNTTHWLHVAFVRVTHIKLSESHSTKNCG